MKELSISYLDHTIHFHTAREMGCVAVPKGCRNMVDTDLDACFDVLTHGRDVWVWYFQDFRRIVCYLLAHYRYVKAAGGLVQTPQGQHLLIRREGQWDVPKGMVESGESIMHAAMREVTEETGIANLQVGPLLLKTYHIYDKYGGWHLKQTSWYAMTTPQQSPTSPQVEESISEAVWVDSDECRQRLATSFDTLKLLSTKIL